LTAGLLGQPLDTGKSTSAVVNVVLAVYFPLQPSGGGLSAAASAGIGVGAGLGTIAIVSGAGLLFYRRRKAKKTQPGSTPAPISTAAVTPDNSYSKPELPAGGPS